MLTGINNNLEQQAQAIFDAIFPSISNGENTIGDTITPKRGKSLLSKNAVFGNVPVVAGGLVPSTYHNVANTVAPVLAISASGANSGYVSLWNIPIWASDSSYIDSSMTDDVYFWYMLLKKRQKEIYDAQTGSAQPHIYPQHIDLLRNKLPYAQTGSSMQTQDKPLSDSFVHAQLNLFQLNCRRIFLKLYPSSFA